MELTPEERHRIYEEEKARLEQQDREEPAGSKAGSQLPQNVAGSLCYLAGWITGVIFLFLEPRNRFVRFHAIQSIVTFGALMIVSGLLSLIPVVGDIFSTILGIMGFVLWIILIIKAYQGEMFRLPLAGDLALAAIKETEQGEVASAPAGRQTEFIQDEAATLRTNSGYPSSRGRIGRIVGDSIAIFWNLVVIIFLSFFHHYIAWYSKQPDGSILRTPILTSEYYEWLPIVITVAVLSIAAYIALLIYDRYWLRETIEITLNILGIVVIASLVRIFPFNFNVLPNQAAANAVSMGITIGLIMLCVIIGIAALVRIIKLAAWVIKYN